MSKRRIILCKAFYEVENDKFYPYEKVLQNHKYRKVVVQRALRELNYWKDSYGIFDELNALVSAIEKGINKITKI